MSSLSQVHINIAKSRVWIWEGFSTEDMPNELVEARSRPRHDFNGGLPKWANYDVQ